MTDMELQEQRHPLLSFVGRRSTESLMETPRPSSSSSASMVSMARRRWTPREVEEHVVVEQEAGRMLDRDGAFHQSRGCWRVERLPHATRFRLFGGARSSTIARHWTFWDDWFHTLAYQRTLILMAILFLTYFVIVFFFAIVYLVVSDLGSHTAVQPDGSIITTSFCDMDINDHMDALYFSLSTMTTIGYGVSDYYFGGCYTPLVLVLMQVCSAITFDALAMGLLFQRLSRAKKRSRTVVFSNQAVIQRVQGMPYLLARVGEIREYQMIEVSVRCYCIMHERLPRNGGHVRDANHVVPIDTAYFVTRPIKLIHPNEESIGPHILMSIPQVLVHQMDETSPLVPSPVWYDRFGRSHAYDFHQHHQHIAHPSKDSGKQYLLQQKALEEFWRDRQVEIVLLVEGTDEMTGASIQSKHSYRCTHNDLLWNRTFAPCVRPWITEDGDDDDDDDDLLLEETGSVYPPLSSEPGSEPFCLSPHNPQAPLPPQEGAANRFFCIDNRVAKEKSFLEPICTVDFDRFHDTLDVPLDSYMSAYIPRRQPLSEL